MSHEAAADSSRDDEGGRRPPEAPEIYVNTESISPDEAVAVVVERLCDFGILPESVRLGREEAPAG